MAGLSAAVQVSVNEQTHFIRAPLHQRSAKHPPEGSLTRPALPRSRSFYPLQATGYRLEMLP